MSILLNFFFVRYTRLLFYISVDIFKKNLADNKYFSEFQQYSSYLKREDFKVTYIQQNHSPRKIFTFTY